MHNCFYTGSLNHKATSSLPGQPEPGFHYNQKFSKSHTKITLLNNKTYKIFDSQKNLEAQEHPNQMVVVPSQPYMCFLSYSQAKMPPRSTKIFKTRVLAMYYRERVF